MRFVPRQGALRREAGRDRLALQSAGKGVGAVAPSKKSTAGAKGKAAQRQPIEDAVILESEPAPDAKKAVKKPVSKPAARPAPAPASKPGPSAEAARPAATPTSAAPASDVGPDPQAAAVKPAAAPAGPQAPVARAMAGLWGGVLGGVLALALGFGALWLLRPSLFSDPAPVPPADTASLPAEFAQLSAELASLRAELDRAQAAPIAGAGFEARIGTLQADIALRLDEVSAELERLSASLSVFEGRLAQVEARPPVFEGDAAEVTGELVAEMQAALEAQRAEIGALADDARARIAAAEAEAAALQDAAAAASKRGMARAALSRLLAALDAGGPFAAPLGDLRAASGLAIPDALSQRAEAGVPTLAALRDRFPEAARAAIAASLPAQSDGGMMERLGAFLRVQTGARSVVPREGDDADAVLSRAEQALRIGQIAEAIALVDDLPEAGRAAMADWRSEAAARLTAVTAAAELAQALAAE